MAQAIVQTKLAQIKPTQVAVPRRVAPVALSRRQKAAIIVRLMLAEGSPIPLSALPDGMQAALAQQIGQMRLVDRATVEQVVAEFVAELEQVGLSFPGGLEGALSLMDGHISNATATRLRRMMGIRPDTDPWDRITALPPEALQPVLEEESTEIAAIMLSKLPVPKAAALLGISINQTARIAIHVHHHLADRLGRWLAGSSNLAGRRLRCIAGQRLARAARNGFPRLACRFGGRQAGFGGDRRLLDRLLAGGLFGLLGLGSENRGLYAQSQYSADQQGRLQFLLHSTSPANRGNLTPV